MKQTQLPLTDEEKANVNLLEIIDGRLTGVSNPDKLVGSFVLPDCITEIGVYAFQNYNSLTSITIPDSVTKIGFGAFQNCSSLNRVVIPKSVTLIRSKAFAGCTCLTELTVDSENPVYCSENNIIYTKDKKKLVAAAADLEHIIIPDGVSEIGMCAFQNYSSLTSITIPSSVIKIDIWAFSGCTGLKELTVDNKNPVYCSEDNSIYTKNKKKLIAAAKGLTGVAIPDGVTEIGEHAFSGCSGLTGIVIPESVTVIGACAFSDCTCLTGVTIPDSITEIGTTAFSGCTALTGITIPAGVTIIGEDAFSECTCLTELTVDSENPVYYSENNILYTKDKKRLVTAAGDLKGQLVIPDGVTEICERAFSGHSGLTDITIPTSVTIIGENAFSDCSGLISLVIPASVIEIGLRAFAGCKCLTELIVNSKNPVYCSENNIVYTKDTKCLIAAAGGLEHIIIPDGVTEIGAWAFSGCASLTNVTIPAGVIEIGCWAFKDCISLKNIVIYGSVAEYNISTFYCINPDAHFTVKNETEKKLLINSDNSIRDEQITVDPEL